MYIERVHFNVQSGCSSEGGSVAVPSHGQPPCPEPPNGLLVWARQACRVAGASSRLLAPQWGRTAGSTPSSTPPASLYPPAWWTAPAGGGAGWTAVGHSLLPWPLHSARAAGRPFTLQQLHPQDHPDPTTWPNYAPPPLHLPSHPTWGPASLLAQLSSPWGIPQVGDEPVQEGGLVWPANVDYCLFSGPVASNPSLLVSRATGCAWHQQRWPRWCSWRAWASW